MNIITNNYCNLACEYCFAKDVMEEDRQLLSLDNFRWLLDFIEKSGQDQVRMLGGESTLHPNFIDFLQECKRHRAIHRFQLFSNFIFNEKVAEALKEVSKDLYMSYLVNYNEPKILGEQKLAILERNITTLRDYGDITLGINFYDPNQDWKYIVEAALRHNIKTVRFSITIPNTQEKKELDIKEYFKSFVPVMSQFFLTLALNGLQASTDCNNTPVCMWDDEILRMLAMSNEQVLVAGLCSPVIDVQPSMEAFRCFAHSGNKVNIKDYNNIDELNAYFLETIDSKLDKIDLFPECSSCVSKAVNGKSCGCLAYKTEGAYANRK